MYHRAGLDLTSCLEQGESKQTTPASPAAWLASDTPHRKQLLHPQITHACTRTSATDPLPYFRYTHNAAFSSLCTSIYTTPSQALNTQAARKG